jgi:hypothetical protein
MNLCPFSKYKNSLGEVKKGIHKYRFLNTAIVDYTLTLLGACLITYISNIPLVLTTIVVLIIGVISHMLFGIQTSTLTYLGIKCKS